MEVCLGYDNERAVKEALRCLHCKNPQCIEGCPVSINIPEFINYIKENDIEGAAKEIAKYSSLPAVCGRVCPQESQCEGKCVLGIKGEPLAIGKLEKYAADWARENYVDVSFKEESNNIKVAIIGSGPAGLTCAGDLAKKGMMLPYLKRFTNQVECLYMEFQNLDFLRKKLLRLKLIISENQVLIQKQMLLQVGQ